MPTMTFRERFLGVLQGRPTDRMPWVADLGYWAYSQRLAGTYPSEYEGDEGFVKLHADYHVGYYLGYASVWTEAYEGVQVSSETEGDFTTTRWTTPVGEIHGITKFLPETASGAHTKWPVTEPEDLRVLRYIADATRITPTYEHYERQKQVAGEQGHPTVLPHRSPVSQMLAQWTGAVHLSYLLADAKAEVERTFEALGNAADGVYDAILGCDTPFVELPDNLTGEVVTGLFERYQFDYYLKRLAPLQAAGKKVGVHLDGTMHGILPLLVKTGLDFIESITPEPCGDVAVADLRDFAGPDIVLIGGMPGAMFAPPFGADDIKRQVELIHEHHRASGKFILGAADQIPPNGDMGLVRLVGELCEEG